MVGLGYEEVAEVVAMKMLNIETKSTYKCLFIHTLANAPAVVSNTITKTKLQSYYTSV
jgi:hypothetical protein